MQNYIGVKEVKARPMTKKEYWEYRGGVVPSNEDPNEEVYLIEYPEDSDSKPNHPNHKGYISMSPKSVFDKAYRSTSGLTFGLAVEAAKLGKKIARKGWNGAEMFVVLSPGAKQLPSDKFFNKDLAVHAASLGGHMDVRPSFMLKTAQDDVAYWAPSGSDALAEDWLIVE